jgi:hypothetical protein
LRSVVTRARRRPSVGGLSFFHVEEEPMVKYLSIESSEPSLPELLAAYEQIRSW